MELDVRNEYIKEGPEGKREREEAFIDKKELRPKEKPTRKEKMVCRLLKVEVSGDRQAWTRQCRNPDLQ